MSVCLCVCVSICPLQVRMGMFIFCFDIYAAKTLLTRSCLGGHLGGILTLAIHNSPNNGPIDLISGEDMTLHVMAIHFCILHHVSWTIIDEVTVTLSIGLVGLLVVE